MTVFAPHPGPQTRACEWGGRYLLTGGAKGGGKSEFLLFDPFHQIYVEEERVAKGEIDSSTGRAIFFRRNYDHLREVISRAKRLFPRAFPEVKWNGQTRTFTFPSGYEYIFGNMDEDDDWQKYYGIQFTWIGFDELTQFNEKQWEELDTCLRSTDPVLQKMLAMRAGTNPVGIGIKWVRKRFVEVAPPNTPVIKRIPVEIIENGVKVKRIVEHSQIFIPAKVADNPSIDQAEYTATLSTKSEAMVRALRDGDWYVSDGAFLSALWDSTVHTVKPFKLPKGWVRFRSCYYAYEKPASVSWWAADPDGNIVCFKNLTLTHHDAEMLAYRIKEIEVALELWDPRRNCSKIRGHLGPDEAWGHEKHTGPTVAETMGRAGVFWWKADKDRMGADNQVRWRLARRTADPDRLGPGKKPILNVPGIRWFRTCKDPIDTIPTLVPDKNNPDIPDMKAEVHNYLDTGYACLSRPLIPEREMEHIQHDEDLDAEFPKPAARGKRTSYGIW